MSLLSKSRKFPVLIVAGFLLPARITSSKFSFIQPGCASSARGAGGALDSSKVTASVSFHEPGVSLARMRRLQLQPVVLGASVVPSSLVLSTDLADAPEKATTVSFEIAGLAGPKASTVAFRVPLEFVARVSAPVARTPSEPDQSQALVSRGSCRGGGRIPLLTP